MLRLGRSVPLNLLRLRARRAGALIAVPGGFLRREESSMPSASITARKTKRGGRRYAVRYRLGGRATRFSTAARSRR